MQGRRATVWPARRNVLAAVLALAAAVLAAVAGVPRERAAADAATNGSFFFGNTTGTPVTALTVTEGQAACINIHRGGGTAGSQQVRVDRTSGSAADVSGFGSMYVSFSAGQVNRTIDFPGGIGSCLLTVDNSTNDGPRTVTFKINEVVGGGAIGTFHTFTLTILDNDGPGTLQFASATYTVNEGAGTVNIAVTRINGSSGPASVQCNVSPGTATSSDYTAVTPQTLNWNSGDASPKPCVITILQDTSVEGPETINLSLSGATGATLGTPATAVLTILDDDGTGVIQFTSATYTGSEAGGPITITVSRTGGTVGAVTVGWSSAGTGAFPLTPGVDFNPVSGTLTWADGEGGTKSFTITPVLDLIPESTETATLTLTIQSGGAVLGSPSTATLQITDSTNIPVITSIVPNVGPTTGGQTVTINGQNFTGATSVTFGGTPCTSFTVVSATQITCVTPPRPAGVAEVVVTTPQGSNVTTGTANDYLYTSGPTVLSLTPSEGACNGATVVTVTGTGFTSSGMTVTFGTVQAVFTYISSTTLVAVAPVQGAGVVDVRVTTPAGTSPNTAADDFTCTGTPIPTVTGLNPTSGPIGTTVTITGTNFTGVTSVTFGGVSATFTVVSSTQITATVPAGTPPGVVDVRVTNAAGTSPNTSADNFTNTSTSTIQYTLYRTFTLIVWTGADNKPIAQAIGGTQAGTTNVSALIGAVWLFNPQTQSWAGYFPGTENVPGANDFTTFRAGTAYFIALRPTAPATVSWVAPAN